ncbi:MAG: choice-of-anchor D domain-containing protein [Proteobacteria bacterium]|nr:choice-of-anchor D domain-containing protein [Pseudomonadota bacterium]MCP4918885.1 choice-of-anchor D domain-containing protein [Pseudomonadota bacterium]
MSLLLLLACEPIGPGSGLPDNDRTDAGEGQLSIERTRVDFGTLSVLDDGSASEVLRVRNTGDAELVVAGLGWIVGDDAFTSDAEALVELAPGESTDVTLTFAPTTDGLFEAVLFPNGAVQISLSGQGRAPVLRLLAEETDLGSIPVGCATTSQITLLNDGSEDLLVLSAELAGAEGFSLEEGPPAVLAPGDHANLFARFEPLEGGLQEGLLTVASDDPASPTAVLPFSALAVPGERVQLSVPYIPGPPVDVLFVVDGTATSELWDAQDAAQALFDRLDELEAEWNVSVANGVAACHSTYDPFLSSAVYEPETAGPALAYGLSPHSSGTAALLELAVSLVERTGEGDCLEGFLHEDAPLHVVLVSDREEASPLSHETYVSQLADKLGDPDRLIISAVTGDGDTCTDGGQSRDAAELTGGLDVDVCSADWATTLAEIAELSVATAEADLSIVLDLPAVVETLELSHGGRELKAWTYDADTRTVTVDGVTEELQLGAEIDLTYLSAQACP